MSLDRYHGSVLEAVMHLTPRGRIWQLFTVVWFLKAKRRWDVKPMRWVLHSIQDSQGNSSSSYDKFTFVSSWERSNLFDAAWCFARHFAIVLKLKRSLSLQSRMATNYKHKYDKSQPWNELFEKTLTLYYGDGIRLEVAARFIFPWCYLCFKRLTFALPFSSYMSEMLAQRVFYLHGSPRFFPPGALINIPQLHFNRGRH